MNIPSEHDEQVMLFKRYRLLQRKYEGLDMAHANPNGGERNIIVATRLKAEGVKSGIPDIHIPIPKGEYSGLWIELKRLKGSSFANNQKYWINKLNKFGAFAVMCKGADEALRVTEMYFNESIGLDNLQIEYEVGLGKLDKQYR